MAPRKHTKPKTAAQERSREDSQTTPTHGSSSGAPDSSAVVNPASLSKSDVSSIRTSRSTPKWYGDSWPRISKAAAVTQVARETVSAAVARERSGDTDSTASLEPATDGKQPTNQPVSPSISLTRKPGTVDKTQPISATPTKVNIAGTGAGKSLDGVPNAIKDDPCTTAQDNAPSASAVDPQNSPNADQNEQAAVDEDSKVKAQEPSSWFSWLPMTGASAPPQEAQATEDDAVANRLPRTEELGSRSLDGENTGIVTGQQEHNQAPDRQHGEMSQTQQYGKSWLGYWYRGNGLTTMAGHDALKPTSEQQNKDNATADEEFQAETTTVPSQTTTESSPIPPRASVWAFWSRANAGPPEDPVDDKGGPKDPSPTDAIAGEGKDQPKSAKPKPSQPKSPQINEPPRKPEQGLLPTVEDNTSQKAASTSAPVKTPDTALKQVSQRPESSNMAIPLIHDTYSPTDTESLLSHLTRMFLPGKYSHPRHTSLVQHPPRIKRALAIGVHGFFPAQFVRTFIGRPTGTSFKFASTAADAIKDWTAKRGYECEVEAIALEGEGKIAERVDLLWKLMLNWIEKIRKADFVLVACHSQGVPVAMMLVAKLIEFGCLHSARVGVCAMAGINLGPFPDYKSRLFSGSSAGELFEFSDSKSGVSKRYEDALRIAVKHGVRVVFIGSIDDQLVPLESSIFSTVNHPYIYRAVFVDGRVHAPDFITHLVGFTLKLRNRGISDHGLIRELSSPLAGSLYSGEGHSRLYDDRIVYDLAIEFALETTSVGDAPLMVQQYEPRNPSSNNPFFLPWAMRGLLEEDYVRTALRHEAAELLALFESWRPTTKVLKDVKFRLEAVKSKL